MADLPSRRGRQPPAIVPRLTRVLAWEPMLLGRYDIVVDVDGNGVYTKGSIWSITSARAGRGHRLDAGIG